MKVIQLDRNLHYGGEAASVNLTNLWKNFGREDKLPENLGENRDWNIDLVPKVLLASGGLVKMLIKTNVSQYLDFKCLESQFVLKGNELLKIPSNDKEALSTDLLTLSEKANCTRFFQFVQDFKLNDASTHQGLDINAPFKDFIQAFSFDQNLIDFTGYAVCHALNDEYLLHPAKNILKRIQVYLDSAGKYGDTPFIYPIYGLSGLPEGFSRLCAINKGITILAKNIDEISIDNGRFTGVKSGSEVNNFLKQVFYGKTLITDPTYLTSNSNVVSKGKAVRAICILDHPIPNTNNSHSGQIFIPKTQLNRQNGIIFLN